MPFLHGGGSLPLIGKRAGQMVGAGGGGATVERPEVLSYSVATPPDPLGSITANISAGIIGVRFEVAEAVRAWSIRAYFPNSGYTISEMRIEDSAGTVLATTGPLAGVETVAATWVERDLESYVELEPGVEYRLIAVMGEVYRHYYGANPYGAPVTMLGGVRASSTYVDGMGWVDLGHETLSEGGGNFGDLSGTYVEEIPFPTGFTTVYGLVMIGSSVWLAALGSGEANHHLQVDPADGSLITGFPSPTGGARAICEGENGTFWSKPYSGDTTRIDPADGSELQRVSFAGTTNRGLAWRPEVDPDRIWYGYTTNTIAAFDLATGSVLEEYTIPFSGLFDNYQDFAWDQATGTWWFLDPAGGGEDYLHQIDPDTGTVLQTIQIDAAAAGTATSFLAMALVNGKLWLANSNNDFITVIE